MNFDPPSPLPKPMPRQSLSREKWLTSITPTPADQLLSRRTCTKAEIPQPSSIKSTTQSAEYVLPSQNTPAGTAGLTIEIWKDPLILEGNTRAKEKEKNRYRLARSL